MSITLTPISEVNNPSATISDVKIAIDLLIANQIQLKDYACAFEDIICDLAELNTTEKGCIVAAINELLVRISEVADMIRYESLSDNQDGTYTFDNAAGEQTLIDTRVYHDDSLVGTGIPTDRLRVNFDRICTDADTINGTVAASEKFILCTPQGVKSRSVFDLLCDISNASPSEEAGLTGEERVIVCIGGEPRQVRINQIGSDVTIVDNGDGTYTATVGNLPPVLIDTRAPSNPFDASNFVASSYNGSPIDNVDEALNALSDLLAGLLGGDDFTILNNPTLYVREATGDDNNDGSSPSQAFKTYNGLRSFIQNAYLIGDVTIDSIRTETQRQAWTASDFKGAGKVTLRPGDGNPANLVFDWGQNATSFDHGLIVSDGLNLIIKDATWRAAPNSNYATAMAARDRGNITLDGTQHFIGTTSNFQRLFEATEGGKIIIDRGGSGTTPSVLLDVDLNAGSGLRNMFLGTSTGQFLLSEFELLYRRNFNIESQLIALESGAQMYIEEGPGQPYEPRVTGPGFASGDIYKLTGAGSTIKQTRVNALQYGQEATFWRVNGSAGMYNGIGTFTDYGGQIRHGNQGTYH